MKRIGLSLLSAMSLLAGCQPAGLQSASAEAGGTAEVESDEAAYRAVSARPWRIVLSDDGTGDWTEQWFLDGEKARVVNSPEGMTLHAGPVPDDDASHAVLWTRRSFEGDVRVEYDYTRLDTSHRGVNILYLLATGSGEGPHAKDIAEWNQLRRVPSMGLYFRNMHTYSISYAAGPYNEQGEPAGEDYVRARRYMPEDGTLRGTDYAPTYRRTGFFLEGVTHHIVVVKSGDRLFMEVVNPSQRRLFVWKADTLPNITEGRVGFRQMFTRSARYRNIKVSVPEK
jgi:hypothetical protein